MGRYRVNVFYLDAVTVKQPRLGAVMTALISRKGRSLTIEIHQPELTFQRRDSEIVLHDTEDGGEDRPGDGHQVTALHVKVGDNVRPGDVSCVLISISGCWSLLGRRRAYQQLLS